MIFLARTSADAAEIASISGVVDLQPLDEALVMIDADLTRSKLYHRLKALQPADEPLLVAELTAVPKFKDMEPGALAWARDHLPRD
ncbi:MAG: hypothetical protein JWO77_2353 [Ilumatobacteraceae bacterium]|nr:hypothetical protein [Ilumatobacteraceae bacterium]